MHERAVTSVRTLVGDTKEFPVTVIYIKNRRWAHTCLP